MKTKWYFVLELAFRKPLDQDVVTDSPIVLNMNPVLDAGKSQLSTKEKELKIKPTPNLRMNPVLCKIMQVI